MWWPLYYTGIYLMVAAFQIASAWDPKAGRWLKGRRNWKAQYQKLRDKKAPRIWFHVSSLGEFEQARPVIEAIKDHNPSTEIILTFFSPSGYEIRKEYPVTMVGYLPADLPGNARQWIDLVQPDIAVFVKYDLWSGYLAVLHKRNIRSVLISAHFQPGGLFRSWSFPLNRKYLKSFDRIFLQTGMHLTYLSGKGFQNLEVAGDTRIDRVRQLPAEARTRLPQSILSLDGFDVICGSTWAADEEILVPALTELHLRAIIAPHDVSPSNISRLRSLCPPETIVFSEFGTGVTDAKLLIIDSIGMLSALYAVGRVAYIGGGFGKGIHNVLEPMAFGLPVIFGPRYKGFIEAEATVSQNGARSIRSKEELKVALNYFVDPVCGKTAGQVNSAYLEQHAGATSRVTDYLLESLPWRAS